MRDLLDDPFTPACVPIDERLIRLNDAHKIVRGVSEEIIDSRKALASSTALALSLALDKIQNAMYEYWLCYCHEGTEAV